MEDYTQNPTFKQKNLDDPTLKSTVGRYLELGTTVGGMAARLIGQEYLGLSIDDGAYAKNLTASLGSLKGPLMKIAQFLATIPGAIPTEYGEQLLSLQSSAPPMGHFFVKRRMMAELGPGWQSKFDSFDLDASAAASLGQVHRAVVGGKTVACKLQYPQMQSVIETDLANLKAMFKVYNIWSKALDTTDVQNEIRARLLEELDYGHEAAQMDLYANIFAGTDWVTVPKVLPDLSTNRLLTMEWMDGKPIYDFTEEGEGARNALAEKLFKAWYMPLYKNFVIHGDPHPGNYLVDSNHNLQLLDFGCIRHFPETFVQGIVLLYQALLHKNQRREAEAYDLLGFKNLTPQVMEIIHSWAELLYEPLLDDRVRPIQEDFNGKKGWETATKVHEKLKQAGGIRPPQEFVFMDRATVGIGGVMMRLKARLNWHQLFESLIV